MNSIQLRTHSITRFSPPKLLICTLAVLLNACSQSSLHKAGGIEAENMAKKPLNALNAPATDAITVVAVGDIMLGASAQDILDRHGYDYPFKYMTPLFKQADVVIGNLEGPLTHLNPNKMSVKQRGYQKKKYRFYSAPDKSAAAFKQAGFNLFNLANNHILDAGAQGLDDTFTTLKKYNIDAVGAGNTLKQARKGRIIDTPNGRIAFASYTLTFPKSFWATPERPGAPFGHADYIRQDIQRLKQITDTVVVSFHWGQEKTTKLRSYQPRLARLAIDSGAALVIGHHPHILQAVEEYKHGLILYSLGNFVFGSYSPSAKDSMVARIQLKDGRFSKAEFTPINVLNTEVLFQPKALTGAAASAVIDRLNRLSTPLNTRLAKLNNQGLLQASTNNIQSLSAND